MHESCSASWIVDQARTLLTKEKIWKLLTHTHNPKNNQDVPCPIKIFTQKKICKTSLLVPKPLECQVKTRENNTEPGFNTIKPWLAWQGQVNLESLEVALALGTFQEHGCRKNVNQLPNDKSAELIIPKCSKTLNSSFYRRRWIY